MTPEFYEKMLKAQNGKCAICNSVCSSGKNLGVDHDHQTGKIRGLLCVDCNLTLGKMRDNPKFLRAAASYLERNGIYK